MIRHNYADVNGVRLHYASAGAGDVVLFLHGFPEFWYAWRHQLREFGKDHHAVAVDMRGYNLSSKPTGVGEYAIERQVADIGGLADHLGAKKFVLVAHDWGGVSAWVYAANYPERISRLVIINSPHPTVFRREIATNPRQKRASAYMLAFQLPGIERVLSIKQFWLLRRKVLAPLVADGALSEADCDAYLEAWSQPGALKGGLNYYRAAAKARGRKLPVVQTPTLVIWGEMDRYLLKGNLEGLDEVVRDLRIERVSDTDHWIVHRQPEVVNRLIREFLTAPA